MKALMTAALFLVSVNALGYEIEDLRRIQHQQEAEQIRQQALQAGRHAEKTSDAQDANSDANRVYETQNTGRTTMPQSSGAQSRNPAMQPGFDSQSAEQYAQKTAIQRMVDMQRGTVPGAYGR